ncbi:major facilitator superfamily protein [Hirsutella rhossiliensis]|uniref:Major facilitator superfamily domain-containing protein n=1 Tax=Hirsutella rhossiliensis TaxID=111463 RepID=A0A9P8SC26_9HYPO|nr:major facilitator superfamily domain-containing protein [Hirsutella rhossiliensis]KAH0957106.1 major facilitator superfamily domain-containing protein [Hirsutella rhossiliensis]
MLMLAMIAIIVSWDVTALSLALPVIADQLHGTNFQSFWASIAFILGIAVTQPIYASISDVVGRKYALYTSIILFGIGSIVFATATNMKIVVAGRLIKGLGAGGLDVLQTIILCDITTLKERPRWLGVMSMANAVGAVTGPFIGGITGVLAFFFLHLTPIEGGIKHKVRTLDWSGFALFTVIGTTVALPLSWANTLYAWGSWQTLVPLGVGLLLLVPFGFVEKRAAVPMIPYQIFDNVSIITGTVSGLLYGALLNPALLYLPLFFQAVYLETPIEAAKSTLPLCCLVVAMSIIVSMLIDWNRKYRIALWAGWSLTTIFLGLNYMVGADTSRAQTYAFQALLGAGLGTALMATMITVLASVRRVDDEGRAAGMLVTARFVGSLLGLAVCSTVFSSIFQKRLSSVRDLPRQLAVLQDASQAVGFIPRLREVHVSGDFMRVVTGAYEDAFQTIWVVLAAFSGLAALLSVLTRENSLEKDDVGRQGFKAPSE